MSTIALPFELRRGTSPSLVLTETGNGADFHNCDQSLKSNPLFDLIAHGLVPWVAKESPVMMEMIRSACDLESARLDQSEDGRSLLFPLMKSRQDVLTHKTPYGEIIPVAARKILCLRTALDILRRSHDIQISNRQDAIKLRGVAMAMIFLADHAEAEEITPQNYNQWAMDYLYTDLDRGDHATYCAKHATLAAIAKNKIHAAMHEFPAHAVFDSVNFLGMRNNDLELCVRTICHFLPHGELLAMLSATRQPPQKNENSDLIWHFNRRGCDELFRRETETHPGHNTRGGRNMAAVRCRIECAYSMNR